MIDSQMMAKLLQAFGWKWLTPVLINWFLREMVVSTGDATWISFKEIIFDLDLHMLRFGAFLRAWYWSIFRFSHQF